MCCRREGTKAEIVGKHSGEVGPCDRLPLQVMAKFLVDEIDT